MASKYTAIGAWTVHHVKSRMEMKFHQWRWRVCTIITGVPPPHGPQQPTKGRDGETTVQLYQTGWAHCRRGAIQMESCVAPSTDYVHQLILCSKRISSDSAEVVGRLSLFPDKSILLIFSHFSHCFFLMHVGHRTAVSGDRNKRLVTIKCELARL